MTPVHNLPAVRDSGFFGRRKELADVESWLANQGVRRITLTGPSGQGKTELALEVGRRLLRGGMFERAVWVDYANLPIKEARGLAVANVGAVLDKRFATHFEAAYALAEAPTLLILDNLESLSPEPLAELLDAAKLWSEAEGCRVLLTSRSPDFNHPDFPSAGSFVHGRIQLQGLGSRDYPDDALDWFDRLNRLPLADESQRPSAPRREELLALFDQVGFHPLSISVLAQQLATRDVAELGARLEQLLAEEANSLTAAPGIPPSLIASIQLSLERLSAADQEALVKLGVFQGGAMEDSVFAVTGLGLPGVDVERQRIEQQLAIWDSNDVRAILKLLGEEVPEDAEIAPGTLEEIKGHPELRLQIERLRGQLAEMPPGDPEAENRWPRLRAQLEAAALIEPVRLPGANSPFLRFHPSLAPVLWAGLGADEQAELGLKHRQRYFQVARFVHHQDQRNPEQARAIARSELPNLLRAVHRTFDAADQDAAEFVDYLNRFLTLFGLSREAKTLTAQAEKGVSTPGSRDWYLAQYNKGEQLLDAGQAGQALEVFQQIRQVFGEAPSEELAVILGRIGCCYADGGRPDLAEAEFRKAITLTRALGQGDGVQRQRGILHTSLGNVAMAQGKLSEAEAQYQTGLELAERQRDQRQQGVAMGQLGTLSRRQGNRPKAIRRYQEALALFERLNEPGTVAVYHDQLADAFSEGQDWHQAEQHYRESAKLKEEVGDLAGAARTWTKLAVVCGNSGRFEAAETWYRKAIEVDHENPKELALRLNNLANLLQDQSDRLGEARELAEQALGVNQALETGTAQIWKTYEILARIATKQSQPDQAATYRRQAREAKRAYPGTLHEMRQFAQEINALVGALQGQSEASAAADQWQKQLQLAGDEVAELNKSVTALRQGERNADRLCESLDLDAAMLIETTLQALEEPQVLAALQADGRG